MEVEDFAAMADTFHERVERIVWCSVATQDRKGRLRSRILHPVWQKPSKDNPFGWILTGRQSHKAKHLEHNPYMTLSYWDPQQEQVYVDAKAAWQDDPAEKERIWNEVASRPEPYGYDPSIIWPSHSDDSFGVLELRPWRVELYSLQMMAGTNDIRVWRAR